MPLTLDDGTPQIGELLPAAIQAGSALDSAGTSRDLIALLARLRAVDTDEADQSLASAQHFLLGNAAALQLLADVDQTSRTGRPDQFPFGPVRDVDAGAIERLAMLTLIGLKSLNYLAFFSQSVVDFVRASSGGSPPVFHAASLVQDRLGRTTLSALRWRNLAIPPLLQASFELPELVAAATGGPLPGEWADAEDWLTPWVESRPSLKPDPRDVRTDGFLNGNRPAAIHPLVLRILRPKVQVMLASPDAAVADEAAAFNAFLADTTIAASGTVTAGLNVFPPAFPPTEVPACALSAGAFILASAQARGVSISAEFPISPTPTETALWRELIGRVLMALVFGSESGPQHLPPAWADKARVMELLEACSDWAPTKFGTPLRDMAKLLLEQATGRTLLNGLPQGGAAVPLDQLLPGVERLAPLAARPEGARDEIVGASVEAAAAAASIRTISDQAAFHRQAFEGRFSSPIAERTLADLLPTEGASHQLDVTDGAVGTYLISQVSRLTPAALAEAFESGGKWATAVNHVGSNITDHLSTWVALELWDGLRGRLLMPKSTDEAKLADNLAKQLPDWLRGGATDPPSAISLDQLRPTLAAIALLGLPLAPWPDFPQQMTFNQLLARIGTFLDPSLQLDEGTRGLLAAAHVELTLTFISVSSNDLAPGQVFGAFDDLRQFADRGGKALKSTAAWDTRAGLNALTLLARLADVTGDPVTAGMLDPFFTNDVKELVASSVVRVLSTSTPGPALSALPLALVGSDLSRFARDSIEAIDAAPIRPPPPWITSPQLPPELNGRANQLIDKLAAQFADQGVNPLRGFGWCGGRAGRSLLLCLFQIKLNEFVRRRRFTVDPIRQNDSDLQALRQLQRAVRAVFCTERILLTGLPPAGAAPAPWWSAGFWSARASGAVSAPVTDPRTFLLVNWAANSAIDVDVKQLGLAATLEAAVPVVREGEELDVDRCSKFALPDLSFQAALDALNAAIADLKVAEHDYRDALFHQTEIQQSQEIISLLEKPLLLETADFDEQVQAAEADVRKAEADLSAAEHELGASQFEQASAALIYQSSLLECNRQALIKGLGGLEEKVDQLKQDIEDRQTTIDQLGVDVAQLSEASAQDIHDKAKNCLDLAVTSRALLSDQIKFLNLLLNEPTPADDPPQAKGLIAKMGMKLESSLRKRLDDDRKDAEQKLLEAQAEEERQREEEERRRELESQTSLIKGVLGFAGGVVGFALGGPAGAALGSSIAGGAGDLAAGIIEKKPVEEIVVGLAGDAFTAAKAGGVNLDGLLSEIGSTTGNDAEQLFNKVDSSLQPTLDNLPRVLDEPLIRDAFKDLSFQQVPDFDALVGSTIQGLRADSAPLGDLAPLLNDAGVQSPIAFSDPEDFRRQLAKRIDENIAGKPDLLSGVSKVVGMNDPLPEDQVATAADRLSMLVATRLGLGASAYQAEVLKNWISAKQHETPPKSWDQVAQEGEALLTQLYPDPRARSEVQANVQLALLDPQTFRGKLQVMLAPWQRELDGKIREVREAAQLDSRPRPANALEAAQARVDLIRQCKDTLFQSGGLVDFLEGNSQARGQLLQDLDQSDQDNKTATVTLNNDQLQLDESTNDVQIAKKRLDQAKDHLKQTEDLGAIAQVQLEEAALQNKINEIAGLQARDVADAQENAEKSAEQKVKASEARVDAARANLDARRHLLAGAKLRAAESSRVRESLSRPPLRLQAEESVEGTIAFAGFQHANALERGLRASREILRLLRLIQIPESEFPRPDASLGDPQVAHTLWSASLETQSTAFSDLFHTAAAPTSEIDTIQFTLGPKQIQALIAPGGLKLVLRPGIPRALENDLIQENILGTAANSGRVIAVLLGGKVRDGTNLVSMTGEHYHPRVEYRGDRWVVAPDGARELHFIDVQRVRASRVSFMDPATPDPIGFLVHQSGLQDSQGDPKFSDVPGTPISGTTVLSLESVNPLPIDSLQLTVLYNFFD